MKKDLVHRMGTPVKSIDVGSRSTTTTGAAVTLTGHKSAAIIVDADAWTKGTYTFSLTECDTIGGTYTAVDSSDIIGDAPVIDGSGDDDQAYKFGYKGDKEFIKVVATVTGDATGGAIFGALVIPGDKINGGKLNDV